MKDGFLVYLVAVIWLFTFIAGLSIGEDAGRNDACQSIGLEFVKDKCMKVTREEVK